MKKKGFTLVELLVVIAIIALLMSILMPALAQVRRLAQRMMCGTNLKGLGNAIVTYGDDNMERTPRSGRARSIYIGYDAVNSKTLPKDRWAELELRNAFPFREEGQEATIGSSWYLLIKYADVTPKQFICSGDTGAIIFKTTEHLEASSPKGITEVWDFGAGLSGSLGHRNDPGVHYSYSYHYPFDIPLSTRVNFTLSTSGNPASPVAADRNTYLCKNAANYRTQTGEGITSASWTEQTRTFNDPSRLTIPAAHQRDGFNVLYLDAHVEWERLPNCGIESDNIFQPWTTATNPTTRDKQFGRSDSPSGVFSDATLKTLGPRAETDAFLINEPN